MRRPFFKKRQGWQIDDETRSVGCGPLQLDVTMARGHGWSEKAIKRTADLISRVAKRESGYAQRTHPERFEKCDCGSPKCKTVLFRGDYDHNTGEWTPPKTLKARPAR